MVKTPEQYLSEQLARVEPDAPGKEYSSEEVLFLKKYLGLDEKDLVKGGIGIPSVAPSETQIISSTTTVDMHKESQKRFLARSGGATVSDTAQQNQKEGQRKLEDILQFVSFTIHQQVFALPIGEVQEVIRYIEPTKIPAAPRFVAGIINLRGRVTPLVLLEDFLGMKTGESLQNLFIVVCRSEMLQIGLIVHSVSSLYRVPQVDIDWNLESKIGVGSNILSGIFKEKEHIIGIVSIDRVINKIISE